MPSPGRPAGKRTGVDLTALAIKKLRPGFHRAAHQLFVQVTPRRSMSWVNKFTDPAGKVRHKGLGSLDLVTLAEAKELVLKNRKLIRAGQDPMTRAATMPSFVEVARQFYDAHQNEWGSDQYRRQWWSQMDRYVFTSIGKTQIDQVSTASVLMVIKPLWGVLQYAPTLRGRVEQVWNFGKAAGLVKGDNPAMMQGNLGPLLGDIAQIRQTVHHPALPFSQMPSFMATLRQANTIDARALEFTVLTNVRTDAALGARWTEIDLEVGVWVISKERVKGRKSRRQPFRCPLSRRVVAILEALPRHGEFVFARPNGKPLGSEAMLDCLRTFGLTDADGEPVTVHGFRSAFNDWAAETTGYGHSVIETAMMRTRSRARSRRHTGAVICSDSAWP